MMMSNRNVELVLIDASSPDVDLRKWRPDRPEDVKLLVELEIGVARSGKASLYQLVVATPEGLRAFGGTDGILAERATLVVEEYSWPRIKAWIENTIKKCSSSTLEESVLKLQRYFRWEYEDYQTE